MAGDRLRRGADQPGRALRSPPGGPPAPARLRPRVPLDGDRRRRQGLQGAARRRPRLSRRGGGRGRGAPARARRGRDRRARRHPRRHDVPARAPRRPGHRPRGLAASSTTSPSPSTTSTRRSPTSSAARTTSPTRPSSCSSSRRPTPWGSAPSADQPIYAHLPLLHGPDGKKLSKRHGAASVQELRDAGYLPEAVRNYLALLGWGDTDDETILSTEQLIERFSLERVSKNPAQFDERKLRWLNGRYLRELPVEDLTGAPGGVHRPQRPARRRRDLAREGADAGGLLAAGGLHLRRADRGRGGGRRAREVARRGRARRARRRARRARGRRGAVHAGRGRRPPWRASSPRARPSPSRSSSRSAWRSRGPPSHPGSSRRSRCWGATRRSRGSTRRWRT